MLENNKSNLVTLIFLFTLSGCASIAPGSKTEQLKERNGISALLIPAEFRDVYFVSDNSNERYCRGPDPDFTVQASDGIGLGSSILGSANEEAGISSGQAALSLGGRSTAVLISRELLYRACEMTTNIQADQDTSIKIYDRFLTSLERILEAQTEVGTESATDTTSSIDPIKEKADE